MSGSGWGWMRVSGSGWEWVLTRFSITPHKLIRYVRHIDMYYTKDMGMSEWMWAGN